MWALVSSHLRKLRDSREPCVSRIVTFPCCARFCPLVVQGKTITFEIQSPEVGAKVRKVELNRTFPAVQDPVVYALKVPRTIDQTDVKTEGS